MVGRKSTRGGRGQQNIDKDLKAILGRKGKSRSAEQAVKGVNPNHGKEGKKYSWNCQRCVYAFEERARGYNVEAEGWVSNTDEFVGNGNWMKGYKGQTWERNLGSRTNKVVQSIEQKMSEYGDGARAIVYVAWKSGSAHVFNVVQENGHTIAYDGQSGRRAALAGYINMAKPTRTMLSRVDNLAERNPVLKYALRRGAK